MRATGTFTVTAFNPTSTAPETDIKTALAVGVAVIDKTFSGDIAGRSSTIFTSAFDQPRGVGTYVALESFEGTVDGREGTFNFVHSASTSGSDRTAEYFAIAAESGTGQLAGISGAGGLEIDADGTHRIWLEYEAGA
jgi:Protein of unknown function (DUF3224)